MEEIKGYLLDSDGIVTQEIKEGDKVRITRANSIKSFKDIKDNEPFNFNVKSDFIKFYTNAIDSLVNENMSGTEYRVCIKLLKYIQYESGLIGYSNGKYLTKEAILNVLNEGCKEKNKITLRTLERAIETLTDKKIFAKTRIGNEIKFYVNPFIFMKGQLINKTLYSLFKNSKWAEL